MFTAVTKKIGPGSHSQPRKTLDKIRGKFFVARGLGRPDTAKTTIGDRVHQGFDRLQRFFDPSANSIRHAGYVDVSRRVGRGLTFTANYTFAKSIDDASDASPDIRIVKNGRSAHPHLPP